LSRSLAKKIELVTGDGSIGTPVFAEWVWNYSNHERPQTGYHGDGQHRNLQVT